jgi:hypothetical protein
MKTENREKYHTRPYTLWALLSTAVVLPSLGGVLYDLVGGLTLAQSIAPRGTAAVVCIALAFWLSILVSWLTPVGVSGAGIRSYTSLGLYRPVAWDDIRKVEAVSLLGIRYAKVHRKSGGAPIWIPGFLAQKQRFIAELREHTAFAGPIESAFKAKVGRPTLIAVRPIEVAS